ncbi:methylenetetrahydrofolate dehydrogenase (NADP+) / methenyltetrahydrofolate cyclohydrolase [Granulicatella balaenopterae]|uniref:Bifunctional protein FolD n=1 Tax=Granulicatella balaenopterae TaxID=137733 RepID=A0A1H9GQ79_9LACT|nr:bifunctional methylenetetrahydrofolate dehydrogenase/methenyltetrahydrofolate cyclohydrolase FolD [Granulicatella balaenopterae]SEQ52246.1 methylenetetrahydrofolate dehydrogenase (NADP+) / methenyltetrahydrofolate cyclohydrolase [Granulicatella balaenopterae]
MTTILDGKQLAKEIRQVVATKTRQLIDKAGVTPGLAVVLVGDDPASQTYVKLKERHAKEVGFHSVVRRLDESVSQEEVLAVIRDLNNDQAIDAILVQLPLPQQIDTDIVLRAVEPKKDVDGFHAMNLGNLVQKDETLVPCTPKGIITLLDHYQIDVMGKKVVVVGESLIVGRPMALMCLNRGATVTVCHIHTKDLAAETKQADVLISATGVLGLITKEHLKPGAVVIDVGMVRDSDGSLKGDVCYSEVLPLASAITPVPGGVGPMTIASLLEQTLENTMKLHNIDY